jgi:hypothetical protein
MVLRSGQCDTVLMCMAQLRTKVMIKNIDAMRK